MADGAMARFNRSDTEIFQHMNAHGRCAAAGVAPLLDPAYNLTQRQTFPFADFLQGFP